MNRRFLVRLSLCALALSAAPAARARAADLHTPEVRLPLMKTAPAVDGTVDPGEWAGAARMEGFCKGPTLAPLEASYWIGSDGTSLFIAVVSETPPGGGILRRMVPLPDGADARTWLDDSIELVLDPLRSDTSGRRRLYHANVNANGAVSDTAFIPGGAGETWRGAWRTASKIVGDRWHFELAIPFASMGAAPADISMKPIGVRICRNWKQTGLASQTQWSPLGGAYLNPDTLPTVTFDPAAPVVQAVGLRDSAGGRVAATIFNPGAVPLSVKALLRFAPASSQPRETERTLTVAPGATLPVDVSGSAANEDVHTMVRISSSDGKTVYYLRDFMWRLERPTVAWKTDDTAARKIQTQFAYYPTHNTVHFTADISGFEGRDRVTGARIVLRRAGGPQVAAADLPPFAKSVSRLLWNVPPLADGEYELVLSLAGIATAPVVRPFVRRVMPWEGTKLGMSDAVVEPFTPIEVKGTAVSTVLRTHTMTDIGLWAQVEAKGRPLLARPMRLEVASGGAAVPAAGRLSFTQRTPTRAVADAAWSAAGQRGSARSEWDYDGMMKWTLTIEPSARPIESMTLVIPIEDARAPLFHACTDGLRFNYAGATPSGQGRVWDGSKAARNSIVGSYVPYIWLGGEERGISVFGENDRGWATDPKIPCQEIVRAAGTLELRLNLVAAPTVVAERRTILVGFLATPVKPMPAGWRKWVGSYAMKRGPGVRKISFNGSCWSWGALTPCLDVYPVDADLSLWDEYAKTKRTGVVNKEFFERWLAEKYPNATDEEKKRNRGNVNYGFHILTGNPTDVLVYTNARGVRFDTPEGQTFLDEWHRDAFSTRVWPRGGGVAYDLNPGRSFRDYAMWYYEKMYGTFVDHIYWDDIFLQSCFDVVGSEAYELPDGRIQPASGIFDMRELIRRTAVLKHELRKGSGRMEQPHITNTAIAPILSFAGSHLTWEDRSGARDFQDRFPRDYIRTESIGRQFGNVPFALLLLHGAEKESKERIAWIKRTAAGVLLVHEIRNGGVIPEQDRCLEALYEYGYGTDAVAVYNYWDENLPVTLSRSDAVHLVAAGPGGAMVLVCDYGDGGDVTISLDTARLGIKGALSATNVETGAAVEASGRAVKINLKKHDFALLRIQGS